MAGKCKTIDKGDCEIPGVEGPVFFRKYESHKRGPAIFFNNRRGGKATVYEQERVLWPSGGKPKTYKTDAGLQKALTDVMNIVVEPAEQEAVAA